MGWVPEDHRYWLLPLEVDFNGFNPIELVWYSKVPPRLRNRPCGPVDGNVDRVAEPCFRQVEAFGWPARASPDRARLLLADATGVADLVRSRHTQFSLEGLAAGNYMLTVLDARGTRRSTSRTVAMRPCCWWVVPLIAGAPIRRCPARPRRMRGPSDGVALSGVPP